MVFFLSWKNFRMFAYKWKISHKETLRVQQREGTFAGIMPLTGEGAGIQYTGRRGSLREEHSQPSAGTGRKAVDGHEVQGGKAPAFVITFDVLGSDQGAFFTFAYAAAFGHSTSVEFGLVLVSNCP